MLNKIEIQNFKCFENLYLTLGSLNVFSGLNGMGKSSLIQSMLLLKQSEQQNFLPKKVSLNGEYINLGVSQDVLYEYAEEEVIKLVLGEKDVTVEFNIECKKDSDILAVNCGNFEEISLFNKPFEYLNADRKSPQVIYPKSSFFVDTKSQIGINGEYTIHYLAKYQDNNISWSACENKIVSFKEAVQFWLNEISPNVKLDVTEIENTDLTKLGFYYLDDYKSKTFRPTNVGFGISYVLPVIVALLKATPNSVLILENPEAHLHPKGQRKMGELIALCAATGVQIFLETHSDHILNGIRIAVKNQLLSYETVKLFFFSKMLINKNMKHIVQQPNLQYNGKLDYWPDGFFDEWEKALDEII